MILGVQDHSTVEANGQRRDRLPHGAKLRDAVIHTDDRGSLFEAYDPRWNWHDEPLVYAYAVTIRPGVIKGWAMHLEHDDRYFILSGDMEVVLYDDRQDSPTKGLVSKIYLSEHHRQLLCIPTGVWHADHNVGNKDVLMMNFPTKAYDHAKPDKYRLPLDTDQIPHKFPHTRGW